MTDFDSRLIKIVSSKAVEETIDTINIGLGYTAVVLKNHQCGLCCTLSNSSSSCTVYHQNNDFEGQTADKLLYTLKDEKDTVSRAVIIAMINALNQDETAKMETDSSSIINTMHLKAGNTVAMIGFFAPLVHQMEKAGIKVKAYDIGKKTGNEKDFYNFELPSSDGLILTATSFINCTFSSVMDRLSNYKKPVILMGPSTIMIPELYRDTPVSFLAGTDVNNVIGVLKSVRNGKGTPDLHKSSRKIALRINNF